MAAIHSDDAQRTYVNTLESMLSRDAVDRAKHFVMGRVESDYADSGRLIRDWWVAERVPPVDKIIVNTDYNFPDQCARAARHWVAKLSAARALAELANDGYLETDGGSHRSIDMNQGYTTVVENSGGTTGSWRIDRFDETHPGRVRRGSFSREWAERAPPEEAASAAETGTETRVTGPLMAIVEPDARRDALDSLANLDRDLRRLAESGELSEVSLTLIQEQALPLLAELRMVLEEVASTEAERWGLARRALVGAGKMAMALSAAGRFSAGIAGLATAPEVITNGIRVVEHVGQLIA